MPRSRRTLAALPVLVLLALAGCGGEPEALEPLPPPAPADLCALLPEDAVGALSGTATSDESGNPTAACALRGPGNAAVLVTWLQLEGEQEALAAQQSQCASIDRTTLPEQQVSVEGADEACAGRGSVGARERASLVVRQGDEVVTVRATLPGGQDALTRATALASGLLAELPRPE